MSTNLASIAQILTKMEDIDIQGDEMKHFALEI